MTLVNWFYQTLNLWPPLLRTTILLSGGGRSQVSSDLSFWCCSVIDLWFFHSVEHSWTQLLATIAWLLPWTGFLWSIEPKTYLAQFLKWEMPDSLQWRQKQNMQNTVEQCCLTRGGMSVELLMHSYIVKPWRSLKQSWKKSRVMERVS